MPDVSWNSTMWDGEHDWPSHGEEWSAPWGGAEPQWFGTFYPRIHRFLPAESVLEIATGHGRWSKFIAPQCSRYLGIDLSGSAIAYCEEAFARFDHARFVKNDGLSLEAADDHAFDLVISLDSFVHVEVDVITSYISQTIKKLRKTGVAFFHHSNLLEYADLMPDPAPGFRARSVSGPQVRGIIKAHGGRVLVQEMINWGGGDVLADCFTLFARQDYPSDLQPIIQRNGQFRSEVDIIKASHSAYAKAGISRILSSDDLTLSAD